MGNLWVLVGLLLTLLVGVMAHATTTFDQKRWRLNRTVLPTFSELIRENKDSIVLYWSTAPIHFHYMDTDGPTKIPTGQDRYDTKRNHFIYTDVEQLHHWGAWWRYFRSQFKHDTTVLKIYCPRNLPWDVVQKNMPLHHLPNLQLLRLDCPIDKISKSFFIWNPKLLYLHLNNMNVNMSIDSNTFSYTKHLEFLKLNINSPGLSSDILCPVSNSLAWLKVLGVTSSFSILNGICNQTHFGMLRHIMVKDCTCRLIKKIAISFSQVRSLCLRSNMLTYLDSHAFDDLYYIHTLEISNANLGTFIMSEALDGLYELTLKNNNIQSIQGNIGNWTKFVDLSNNRIINLTSDLFTESPGVLSLNMQKNNIQIIEVDTFHSVFLVDNIDLSMNNITGLEGGYFRNCFKVIKINLSHNQITKLTAKTFATNNDSVLHGRDGSVYATLYFYMSAYLDRALTLLEHLDFSYNAISYIGADTFGFGLRKLKTLNLSHNRIIDIPSEAFLRPPLTTLNLSWNNISTLPCDMLVSGHPAHKCPIKLQVLDLQHNHIHDGSLCFLSSHTCPKNIYSFLQKNNKNLTTLENLYSININFNSLTYMNVSTKSLKNLNTFSFAYNHLTCTCDLAIWLTSLERTNSIVGTGYTCKNLESGITRNLVGIQYKRLIKDYCTNTTYNTTNHITHHTITDYQVAISVCSVVTVGVVVTIMCVCFRMEIAAILYAKTGIRMRRHNPEFGEKRYNVMIWCHDQDIGYARDIITVLERYFTVYWNQRDCMPGEVTERGFERGIMSSERVIVILTRNFVTDYHSQLKFENFHICIGKRFFGAVLIVADDEVIAHKQRIYERVRAYVRTRQYLCHNDRLFWKKLFYKLPPPQDDAGEIVYGDIVQPEINFNRQQPLVDMLPQPAENDIQMAEVNVDDDVNPNIDGYDHDRLVQ